MPLFIALMRAVGNTENWEDALYAISELRSELLINHAFKGYGVEFDKALELLKNVDDNNLTLQEREMRDRLVAAVDNLIEFATCEEYQLSQDIFDVNPDIDLSSEEWDEDDEYFMEDYLLLNAKYNEQYADVENEDAEYAMAMAAWWVSLGKNVYLTYMTQDDHRVRPWHYALHGFSARRDEFPDWMIPPIEWACRCYLIADVEPQAVIDMRLSNSKVNIEKPEQLNGIFKESVCKCGRIFSDEHPYFEIKEKDSKCLGNIVERIKEKYYGKR